MPMITDMRRLLERLKGERPNARPSDTIMRVTDCKKSINAACKALDIPRFTHHDLRHLFATKCIESGVDIPTVSRWLGHKDGGALAMKVYGHLRDQHSTSMAQKVVFTNMPPNVVPLPLSTVSHYDSTLPRSVSTEKKAIAQAKAKYNFPWWASENPIEVFWGQLNEKTAVVPQERFLEVAKLAMEREVFKQELADRDSLKEEFIERISNATFVELTRKIQRKRTDVILKAG